VRLTGISRECRACHKDVHQGQLGERCEKCHGAATFVVKRHLHDEVGKGGRPRDCAACHRPAVERARNPVHAAAGFTGPCEPCHRITDPAWGLGTYAHSSWPLRGVHGRAACNACHASGVYRGLPATCVSCHLEEFQRSQRPNHVEKRFSTDCGTCHKVSDADWFKVAARTP
jgi:hypothetical protein